MDAQSPDVVMLLGDNGYMEYKLDMSEVAEFGTYAVLLQPSSEAVCQIIPGRIGKTLFMQEGLPVVLHCQDIEDHTSS